MNQMNSFNFPCPHCGKLIEADNACCGVEAECPHCASIINVPERPKIVLKKSATIESKIQSCSETKIASKSDFWTLNNILIVGISVIAVLLIICVIFWNRNAKPDTSIGINASEVKTKTASTSPNEDSPRAYEFKIGDSSDFRICLASLMDMRTLIRLIMLFVYILCVSMVEAQWTFSKPQVQTQIANASAARTPAGTGSTTYYNSANGAATGTATKMGNMTYYSNAKEL